jgi:hypothetical protein
VIFRVSLKTIPLVVISPTIRVLSADAIVLPERSKTVDKLASLFKNTLCGKRVMLSIVRTFKRTKRSVAINGRKLGDLIFSREVDCKS